MVIREGWNCVSVCIRAVLADYAPTLFTLAINPLASGI